MFTCDWIARYLPGGEKVYAFHTLDLETHALSQSRSTDKTTETACAHLLDACQSLGLPDLLRMDNDAAFTGLGWRTRLFGRFVRLALYLGIEPLFIPPGEPKRNHEIERANGIWAQQFWDKNHFPTRRALERKTPQFHRWYASYDPPALQGLTVAEATQQHPRCRLTERQRQALPETLPLTAGRIHFVRRVSAKGEIDILTESWRVSRTLCDEYVFATLDLRQQELRVYYRASARAQARLVCCYEYQVEEAVTPLRSEYRRRARRVEMLKII